MIRGSVRLTACTLAALLAISGSGLTAYAAGASSVLPSGGIGLALANGNKLENVTTDLGDSSVKIETIVEQVAAAEPEVVEEAAEPTEEDMFRNLVIAQVNNYVNVRSLPSEEGEIVGKLYDDSVGTFLAEENGWYQINSGSVTGYVKGEFCVTGEEAVELAKKVGTRLATVNTTTLFVRTEATTDSSVLGMVPIEDELVVLDETEGWVKVDVEEGIGWVSTDYVNLHTEFVKAESKEEEERRLAKEEEERRKALEAAEAKKKKEAKAQSNTSSGSESSSSGSSSSSTQTYAVSGGSEMGQAVAEYALQFVGNPYVYGGSSLTNGTDCSGFVMSVYANFGVSLPHSSASDRSQGYAVDGGLANAQPGDLICYSGHVALYIGGGQIVHASTSKTGIIVSNADYKQVLAVRRIF
ncbi:MAG: SH3 domain-containing protein [Lachnospiraceae bacterium]|nr:SH3 domain-containing protein [Lachnospiraceae bacterium]